jgi:hypothetical protein
MVSLGGLALCDTEIQGDARSEMVREMVPQQGMYRLGS